MQIILNENELNKAKNSIGNVKTKITSLQRAVGNCSDSSLKINSKSMFKDIEIELENLEKTLALFSK